MSSANVCHFAIECDDVERARAFYESVFGWRMLAWGPPDYYQIVTGSPEDPGILGDLRVRHKTAGEGGHRAFACTIRVAVLAESIAAIEAHGGRLAHAPYRIEGVGDLAYFEDPEGNRVGVMQYLPEFQPPAGVRF